MTKRAVVRNVVQTPGPAVGTGIAELAALVHGAAVVVVIPHRQPHDVAHVQVQPTARAWPLAQFDK